VAILAAASLFVFAPAAGAAKTRVYHQHAEVVALLSGKATNGFRFDLFAFDHRVSLSFTKSTSEPGSIDVDYSRSGRGGLGGIADGRLDIKVGNQGHFRGHFVTKSTKVQKPQLNCKGDPTTVEKGYFAGSFVFHGERGYTTVQAARANGSITHLGAAICRLPSDGTSYGPETQEISGGPKGVDELSLLAGDRKADLTFQAHRELGSGPESIGLSIFQAGADGGTVGAFHVYRNVFIFDIENDGDSNFLIPKAQEPLAESVIEPPAPFSGSATFQLDGPKKATWTGDLAVELPGAGKLPLTGEDLYAGACHGAKHCTETLPKPLAELLENSGRFSTGITIGEATTEVQTIR
jgi:hypothetical protein